MTHLRQQGILSQICERVRFARPRFGQYEVIDFLTVLFGYAISSERTLEAFYEALKPFASPFMVLFGRDQIPSRSALSRFLAALTQPIIEALRALFLEDGRARPLCTALHPDVWQPTGKSTCALAPCSLTSGRSL